MSTSERNPWHSRRKFLQHLVASIAAARVAGGCGGGGAATDSEGDSTGDSTGDNSGTTSEVPTTGVTTGEPDLEPPGEPFTLGVASGDPLPDSVILWTRLCPQPLEDGGGMPDEPFPVMWEISADEAFTQIVGTDTALSEPALAHSLHIDVKGLQPDTWYWFRFRAGSFQSPVGRTRTSPAFDAQPERLRFATASCQNYSNGYYGAYEHMAKEDLDLVIFLGDYIYEGGLGGPARTHNGPEVETLDQYRARYALYRSDPLLAGMHARCPWLTIWDDHEVDNNYAGAVSQDDDPESEFLQRRAAAYQAFYEHMPMRLDPPTGPEFQIYGVQRWGDLADIWLLDTRQYRDNQNCEDVPGPGCAGWAEYDGTLLGEAQEDWLMQSMRASASVWKVIANQIVFSTVNFNGAFVNFDQWDGYPVARQRLLDFLNDEGFENLVILAGDLHVGGAGDIGAVASDEDSPVIAAEFVTTSISSSSIDDAEAINGLVQGLKRIRYFNALSRGYITHEVTRTQWAARCFIVDSVATPTSPGRVDAELFIDVGVPGLRSDG